MLDDGNNHTCSLCNVVPADMYCCCQGSPVFLCSQDYDHHALKKGAHQPIPVWTFALMPEYCERLGRRNETVRVGLMELRENLRMLESCKGELEAWVTVLIEKIQEIHLGTLNRLNQLQKNFEDLMNEGVLEEAQSHYEDSPVLQTAIAVRLRNYTPGVLTFFHYNLEAIETITTQIVASIAFALEYPEEEGEILIGVPKPTVPAEGAVIHRVKEPPVAVLPGKFLLFDTISFQWRPAISLNGKVEVDNFSATVWVNESSLFVCGGDCSTRSEGRQAYILVDSAVCRVSDMDFGRSGPGVIYLQDKSSVLVFGGTCKGKRIKGCLGFGLHASNWVKLGNMSEPRAMFNPCIVGTLVYLCGGYSRTVERYDPNTGQFHLLKTFSLPGDFTVQNCTTVYDPSRDCLISISKHVITRWDIELRRQPESSIHRAYEPWSRAPPVLLRSQVLLVDLWSRACLAVDLASGSIVSQIPLTPTN